MKPSDSSTYDLIYAADEKYSCHYKDSRYYKIWQRALLMVQEIGNPKVISLGCGTGQFEHMMWDNGLNVIGIDFSYVAIEIASKKETGNLWYCMDLITHFDRYKEWIKERVIVCMETLEHLDDYALLEKLPSGNDIVFMVPLRDSPTHVRLYSDPDSVIKRYSKYINIERFDNHSDRYILCNGKIK